MYLMHQEITKKREDIWYQNDGVYIDSCCVLNLV